MWFDEATLVISTAASSAIAPVWRSMATTSATTTAGTFYDGQIGIWQAEAPTWIVSARTRQMDGGLAAEHAAEQGRNAEVARQAHEQRQAVKLRARALLVSGLSPDQRRCYDDTGYFDVHVGGRQFRIRQGTHGNVRLIEGGRERASYCAQPRGVPDEDAMLAQKLMIETDVEAFLRIANRTELR